jgi:uncharacterized membrane protein YiaA
MTKEHRLFGVVAIIVGVVSFSFPLVCYLLASSGDLELTSDLSITLALVGIIGVAMLAVGLHDVLKK